jgi:hypothetical protein
MIKDYLNVFAVRAFNSNKSALLHHSHPAKIYLSISSNLFALQVGLVSAFPQSVHL